MCKCDRLYGPIKLGGPCDACGWHHPGKTCTQNKIEMDKEIARLIAKLIPTGAVKEMPDA